MLSHCDRSFRSYFYLTHSQYTDTRPTSPSTDPITANTRQGNHWSANYEVNDMTRPGKIRRRKRESNPGLSLSRPTRRLFPGVKSSHLPPSPLLLLPLETISFLVRRIKIKCERVCVFARVSLFLCLCARARMRVCVCVNVCVCVCVRERARARVYVCV